MMISASLAISNTSDESHHSDCGAELSLIHVYAIWFYMMIATSLAISNSSDELHHSVCGA